MNAPRASSLARSSQAPAKEALDELRAMMSGRAFAPAGNDFDAGREVWNAAVTHRPAIIARCVSVADVQAAVTVAVAHGLPLSVKSGGHDWAGRSLRDGGLVIDLSRMRGVTVDTRTRTALVDGGVTIGHLVQVCRRHGLLPVTGTVRTVGMAGLTLGGGYGPLAGKCGLALDNLLAAEVVLADGRCVVADATTNPDLFWALRGGGGNFGVVTRLQYQLHALEPLVAGLAVFPMRDVRVVLRGYREFLAKAPDELTLQMGVLGTPAGPGLFLFPTWSGERSGAEGCLATLASLGTPLSFSIGPTAYEDLLAGFDSFGEPGRHWALRTRSIPELTEAAEAILVEAGNGLTSSRSAISVHHFHGAATRVPVGDTAFGIRQNHLMVELIAGWEPSETDDGSKHRAWADRTAKALEPHAFLGGYPNLLGPGERDRALQSYGPNLARLLEVKRQLDPHDVFASASPALGQSAYPAIAAERKFRNGSR